MTLDQIFEHGKDFSAHAFSETGEVVPMWIAETDKGDVVPICIYLTDKDAAVRSLRKIFEKHNVVRYVSFMEAWVVEPKEKKIPESIMLGAPVSTHPDRREIIWISAEDKNGETRSGCYYILRPEMNEPTLSPFKEHESAESMGRFAHLLT